jgi:hypothetical protein
MAVISWIDNHPRVVFNIALVVIVVLAGIMAWTHFHPPKSETFESQQVAETPVGVQQAANNAQVPLATGQAFEVAKYIQATVNTPPVATVATTGAQLQQTISQEQYKFKADFSIVTDPKNATLAVTPATIAPNTPITLNQFNIQAYPAHLLQIGGSYQEVMMAYSWKVAVPKIPIIAPHGDIGYLGLYSHANFDQPRMSRVGIMLTIAR